MNRLEEEAKAISDFDAHFREKAPLLCGVDEAGRGPLCGPVGVAAVILDPQVALDRIRDSKKLSPKRREALYETIVASALAWEVVLVPPEEIDRVNIHNAVLAGMKQAVENLSIQPDLVLIDGSFKPDIPWPCRTIVKGDAQSATIAAASILAKVTRDRYMCQLGEAYPQYQLSRHKGYPTKLHYALLDQYGPAYFYRRTYLKKWESRK